MVNEQFGDLTVIADAGTNKQNRRLWLCRCVCGNEKVIRADALKAGRSKSCGTCNQEQVVAGKMFGRWTVLEEAGTDEFRNILWTCQCVCGSHGKVVASHLRQGTSTSCGCLRRENAGKKAKETKFRHGHRVTEEGKQSRAYTAWINMKARCNDANRPQWKDWGGRGISYDPKWELFAAFYEDMGDPPVGMSLDRIDNDGNYNKDNCRWADRDTQRRNSRQTWRIADQDGQVLILKDYAAKYGLPYGTIITRLSRGWSLTRALNSNIVANDRQEEGCMKQFDLHIETGESHQPLSNEIMEPDAILKFQISYPLTNPYSFEETHSDGQGWTEVEFVDAVRRAYVHVYDSEADPGRVQGLLNRAKSEGPYGIWGHDLADLFLEGAERRDNGMWDLHVGS